jgi:hypothetical protein
MHSVSDRRESLWIELRGLPCCVTYHGAEFFEASILGYGKIAPTVKELELIFEAIERAVCRRLREGR